MIMLCIVQLRHNWKTALKISWFWWVFGWFCWVFGVYAGPRALFLVMPRYGIYSGRDLAHVLIVLLFIFILVVICLSIVAGAWHRHILREERFGYFLVFRGGGNADYYAWSVLKIAVLLILLFLPVLYYMNLNADSMSAGMRQFAPFVPGVLATWIFFRLGLVLPAIAVGNALNLRESFRITAPIAMQLLVVSAILVTLQIIPTVLLSSIGSLDIENAQVVLTIARMMVLWANFFLVVGVLTVLYGHLCENRPI